MQTLGYSDKECEEFFLNCVDEMLHWKKITESTAENFKKWIQLLCYTFRNIEFEYKDRHLDSYFCIEALRSPEEFQNILQHTKTRANGRIGSLSNSTVANYMQMLTYIMKNIHICTDDEDILHDPAFTPKNIRRWEMAWGSLRIDATNSRLYEYSLKISECNADWGELKLKTRAYYDEDPNNMEHIFPYLLVLTYDILCARNDYARLKIYTRGVQIPMKLKRTTNYIDLNTMTIHVNETKNKDIIAKNRYKTSQPLNVEFLDVLGRSLRLKPREYVFTMKQGGLIDEEKFGEYIKKHLGKFYKYNEDNIQKELVTGCDMVRHMFAQYYYRISREKQFKSNDPKLETDGVRLFLNSIEKMLHGQSTHMTDYVSPYLQAHGVNRKKLDNKTRKYAIVDPVVYMTQEKKNEKKLIFLCKLFNERLKIYGEDYTDVFGPETFGLIHASPDDVKVHLHNNINKNEEVRKAYNNYLDLLNGKYPNKEVGVKPVNYILKSEKISPADKADYKKFLLELAKNITFIYNDRGEKTTNVQMALHNMNPEVARMNPQTVKGNRSNNEQNLREVSRIDYNKLNDGPDAPNKRDKQDEDYEYESDDDDDSSNKRKAKKINKQNKKKRNNDNDEWIPRRSARIAARHNGTGLRFGGAFIKRRIPFRKYFSHFY